MGSRASIGQTQRDPFGPAAANSLLRNANRVETRVGEADAHARAHFDIATLQARARVARYETEDDSFPRTDTLHWAAQAGNLHRASRFAWSADASQALSDNEVAGRRENTRVRASLFASVFPDLRAAISAGHERTDFARQRQESSTPGAGLEWSPSARTQASAVVERRFFGTGYLARVVHRTARTYWRIAALRDASLTPGKPADASTSVEALMHDLILAATQDPERRAAASGLPAEEPAALGGRLDAGFLTTRPYLRREHEVRFEYLGPRTVFAIDYSNRQQRAFDVPLSALATAEEVRRRRLGATITHRITRLASLVLEATRLDTEDLGGSGRESQQDTATATLRVRLGPHATGSLAVRHVRFDDHRAPYRENALFATFTARM